MYTPGTLIFNDNAGNRTRARDIKVDGREAPIRAATACPLGRGAHACHGGSQRPPAQRAPRLGSVLAVWCTPGFLRLAGIWANHLTFMSRAALHYVARGAL